MVSSVVGITTARYFRIALRPSDKAVCFWYKSDPLHAWEYPTLKDEFGEPRYTETADGEMHYSTDPCASSLLKAVALQWY